MSIMDELKKLTRPYDDDDASLLDDDLDMDLEDDEPSYTRTPAAPTPVAEPVNMGNMGGMNNNINSNVSPFSGFGDMPSASPINMGTPTDNSKYRVILVKPEEFDAATAIADHICKGDTVILNCEDTNEQVARRVIDFLSGCAYALNGSIKKASSNVIIIAPKDVGVDDAKDGQQLNG